MPRETIAGFDFHRVEFDRDAGLVDVRQREAVLDAVRHGVTDLLVLSHGWNNDMAEAERLYRALLEGIDVQARGRLDGRRVAVLGVFWPSKKFADRDLIPGGAASLDADLPMLALEEQIVGLRDVLGDDITEALLAEVGGLDTSRAARQRFGEGIQAALAAQVEADEEVAQEVPGAAVSMPPEELFDAIDAGDQLGDAGGVGGAPRLPGAGAPVSGGEGSAAFLAGAWRGFRSSASNLLNLTTYWAMKRRAGRVGARGLHGLLRDAVALRQGDPAGPVRLHLVGHSFGARLVTAAVNAGSDDEAVVVDSMVLLQGAFSHHGFAVDYDEGKDGFFRPVLADSRVRGPLLITHTPRDAANRWAYPAASRLARHTGSARPNADSLYGAIGANGAQRTPRVITDRLRDHTAVYELSDGGVHNLEGSDFITGHSDVHGPEVANAIVAAMTHRRGGGASSADGFDPAVLDTTTIAIPLHERMRRAAPGTRHHVTIDLHLKHPGGSEHARAVVVALILGARVAAEVTPLPAAAADRDGPGTRGAAPRSDSRRLPSEVADHLDGLAVQHGTGVPMRDAVHSDHWHRFDPLGEGWPGLVPASERIVATSEDEQATPSGDAVAERPRRPPIVDTQKGRYTPQYVHAFLTATELRTLVELDLTTTYPPSIYKIWPDFEVEGLTTRSVRTVKADAARIAFSAAGEGIVWAVADTGIEGTHEHFASLKNLDLSGHAPIAHQDFVDSDYDQPTSRDLDGHGTHVAGIIAGQSIVEAVAHDEDGRPVRWEPERWMAGAARDSGGEVTHWRDQVREPVRGVAPRAKLVSLRVLDENGRGRVSNLLAAIGYVQQVNDHGRWIRIHGINLSLGYGFDPEWFACGQSPVCVEVDRLVRSGVSVVAAAGNTGYLRRGGPESADNAGLDLTINDPGNAELAITVGATHRDEPHKYGVSYFSSKGPTGDGRNKPDLVAPGERILSCAAGNRRRRAQDQVGGDDLHYRPETGTSMAAPHVSGAIAAFLSIRPEFEGHPMRIKEIFLDSATDLGRERYFQGHGLVDLMRAIQSV